MCFYFAGAKLVVSQEECTETHSLVTCKKNGCMDLCKNKYPALEPQPCDPCGRESIFTWGECKNIFRCRCHFDCADDYNNIYNP